MNILVLSNKLPYPPRDGGSIATLNMLTGLRDAGNRVTCLSLVTRKHRFPVDRIPESLSGTIRMIGVPCDSTIRPLPMLFNLLFSGKPYIAERFKVREYEEKLRELLRQETFDVIQLEGPYPGHYLDVIRQYSSALVSLRTHNVEHLIWKRKSARESCFPKKWYLKNMAGRLERFELDVVRRSDCLVPISDVDASHFRSAGFGGPSITIPAGISPDDYPEATLPKEPTVFFIGALDWLPNQEGLKWFVDRVWEKLTERIPEVQFHVAGRNAPSGFARWLQEKGVIYHGEVKHAVGFMHTYRVMAAPLLTGSGIRIKILEAMALGRPVVTTPVGIEGIPARDRTEVRVAEDPGAFSDAVAGLLEKEQETLRMTESARLLVRQNFDTFTLSSRLSRFFSHQV